MTAFASSAAFYDVLARRSGRLEREAPLLRHCLEYAPGTHVADIACGTGVHAEWFAAAGASVAAFDLSAEMIAFARAYHAHPAIRYGTGDMRSIGGGPYDLIVCLGNSLSLLADATDLAAVFASAAHVLNDNGLFLAHVINYSAPAACQPRHRIEHAELDDARVTAVKSLVPKGDRTLLALSFFIEETAGWREIAEAATLRNWTAHDLDSAAHSAGFVPHKRWGAFDESNFDEHLSPDLLSLYRKDRPAT